MPGQNITKPAVSICCQPHDGWQAKLREIQAGMEEEGVPWDVLESSTADAVAAAFAGACSSQLGVGVGVSHNGLCIHYYKLPAEQPLFVHRDTGAPVTWRRFGCNAARLVKNMPFKTEVNQPVTSEPEAGQPRREQADGRDNHEDMATLIRAIVEQVLRDTANSQMR